MLSAELSNYIKEIRQLCMEHNVKTLFAFGSAVKDSLKVESDIDMLVDIISNDPYTYTDDYFSLKFKLEELLHRNIDLLEQKALRNPYLEKELNSTKVLIYGR